MFGNKKPLVKSVIEDGSVINGNVSFLTGLEVHGSVNGDIISKNAESILIIGSNSIVEGTIEADYVIVDGIVNGSIYSKQKLYVKKHGQINGNIFYNLLQTEPGCVIKGQLYPVDRCDDKDSI